MISHASGVHVSRAARRRLAGRRVRRAWLVAWLGGSVLGIANGVTRELVYADRVGEAAADDISVAILVALLAVYFAALQRRWPLPTLRAALAVGATWVALTVLFELGFGHWVDGKTWTELAGNYDVLAGRLWVLVLAWIGVGPAATRAAAFRRAQTRQLGT